MANARQAAGGFFADFKEFILRGNVIDLAVAVIIGGAFGQITTSLVGDIITPAILNPAMKAAGVEKLSELTVNGIQYGLFLAAVLNFIVIAFCMFLIIRSFKAAERKMERKEAMAAAEAEPAPDPAIVAQENLTQAIERLITVMESKA
ncbi:MAG: large conductance mechanosensitive channel protein MscL [Spirulinaceae cyanobacterium]